MTIPWSACGLGTAPLGSRPDGPLRWGAQDRATSVRTVQAALDAGVTWIDTAPFYGWGRAEEIVGEAVAARRDEVTLLTKCGTVRRADGTWSEDGSPAAVRAGVEASLRRLRTDHVDVVQLHDPDPRVPVEETVGALDELVGAGLVGAIGLSNHTAALLARGRAVGRIAVVQHQWSLVHHDEEAAGAAGWAAANGARFLAWSPLASGFLTDGFDLETLDADDLRRRLPWATGEGAASVGRLRAAALELGRPLEELALGWALRTGAAIVGARSPAEVRLLVDATAVDDDTAAVLEAAVRRARS